MKAQALKSLPSRQNTDQFLFLGFLISYEVWISAIKKRGKIYHYGFNFGRKMVYVVCNDEIWVKHRQITDLIPIMRSNFVIILETNQFYLILSIVPVTESCILPICLYRLVSLFNNKYSNAIWLWLQERRYWMMDE